MSTNFFYNSIYTMLNVIFPLITIPYVSRVLLADGLGKVNYAINIISWFILFASLGIPRYGVREIPKKRKNQIQLNTIFSELFWLNVITTLICLIIYSLAIINSNYFRHNLSLFLAAGLQLLLNIFNVDWFYQGMEEYEYITKRSIFVKIASLIAMFLFVRTKNDYIIYALIQSLAIAGNNIFNVINLKKHVHFIRNKLNLSRHLIPVMVLLSAQLASSTYTLLDTTMIGILCNNTIVGYYSNSQKIIKTLATLCAALSGVLLPRLVELNKQGNIEEINELSKNVLKILLTICIPICLGLIIVSDIIVKIMFGNDFMPCIITLKVFSPFIIFTSVGNLYGAQLLMAFDQEKKLLISVLIGAITNFTLNLVMIPHLQQNGAAIASFITEGIVMTIQIWFCHKYVIIKIERQFVFKIILQAIFMICVLFIIRYFISSMFISLLFSALVGGIVYFLSGIILKNEAILLMLKQVNKKLK